MKRSLCASVVLLVSASALAGCAGDDASPPEPTSGAPASTSPEPSIDPTPSDEIEEPVIEGAADLDCLVDGSPWDADTDHLSGEMTRMMQGINVTDVSFEGGQTLTIDGDLNAAFTSDLITTIKATMGSGLDMVMVQTQKGESNGSWEADGNILSSAEPWKGSIGGETTVSINGESTGAAPFDIPTGSIGDQTVTYTCADGELAMTIADSPISYRWN